jgi:plasmid stability protein
VTAINLRDVPEELHRALKVRAAERGIKLYALVLEYLEEGLKRDKRKPQKRGG